MARMEELSECSREAEFIRVALPLATLANPDNRVDAEPADQTSSDGASCCSCCTDHVTLYRSLLPTLPERRRKGRGLPRKGRGLPCKVTDA